MEGSRTPSDALTPQLRDTTARQINVREFWGIVFLHKWTIALSFVVILAAILWGLSLRGRSYVASVKIYVNRNLTQQVSLAYVGRLEWAEEINSIAEIGRSQGVLTAAARMYDQRRGWPDPPPERVQFIAAGLATMVEVLPVQETSIINILVHDEDPDSALIVADVYGQAFLEEHQRISHQSQGREFFNNALDDVQQRISETLSAKAELQEDTEVYNWSQQQQSLTETEQSLLRELTRKRTERMVLERQVEMERAQLERGSDTVVTLSLRQDRLLEIVEARVADLQLELAELSSRYTDDNRLVQVKRHELAAARRQREDLLRRLVAEREQHLEALRAGERVLQDAIEETRRVLRAIPASVAQLSYYDAYIERQWELYRELIVKYNDTLASDEQSLVERQLVRLGPPNIGGIEGEMPRVVIVLVAPIFALLLALAIAFMVEATTHSFQKAAEIEAFCDLPVLATFRKI